MIAIVGSGNVATHLYKALEDKTKVVMVNPRTLEELNSDVDIILLCVSDDAIKEVSDRIGETGALLAHTSGSVPLSVLAGKGSESGVFYPLQTFSKGVELNYREIPLFIEASSKEGLKKLRQIGELLSDNIHEADSESRRKLHLASVFACNFTNALAGIADGLLMDSGFDIKVILPLLKQTIDKLHLLSPKEAQTGPAKRGDSEVMESHLKMLEEKPRLKELYSLMSDIIKNA